MAPAVTVENGEWRRNGRAWYPHGFNMVGLATPPKCVDERGEELPDWVTRANETFAEHGAAELTAARRDWNADTVRFQVSQLGLDPEHPYSQDGGDYLDVIKTGVERARDLGFTVILSMRHQVAACGENDRPCQRPPDAIRCGPEAGLNVQNFYRRLPGS